VSCKTPFQYFPVLTFLIQQKMTGGIWIQHGPLLPLSMTQTQLPQIRLAPLHPRNRLHGTWRNPSLPCLARRTPAPIFRSLTSVKWRPIHMKRGRTKTRWNPSNPCPTNETPAQALKVSLPMRWTPIRTKSVPPRTR